MYSEYFTAQEFQLGLGIWVGWGRETRTQKEVSSLLLPSVNVGGQYWPFGSADGGACPQEEAT